jgi:hypothetical protein
MAIIAECPSCKTRYSITEERASSKQLPCLKCNQPLWGPKGPVPQAGVATTKAGANPAPSPSLTDELPQKAARARRSKMAQGTTTSGSKGWVWACTGLAMVAVMGFLVGQSMPKTEPAPDQAVKIEVEGDKPGIGEFEIRGSISYDKDRFKIFSLDHGGNLALLGEYRSGWPTPETEARLKPLIGKTVTIIGEIHPLGDRLYKWRFKGDRVAIQGTTKEGPRGKPK